MSAESAVEALRLPEIQAWLTNRRQRVEPPLSAELIPGGRSNLSFRLCDAGGRQWVLRRPPLGSRLPSAHDMAREHRILAALQETPIPVPPIVGLNETIHDDPFYVMEFVEGSVVRSRAAAEALPLATRRQVSDELVDTLAALHAVDPDAVGLGTLGRRTDYVARQLRRWQRQWEQQQAAPLRLIDELHEAMSGEVPPQQASGIVHGDYKLDNTILASDGRIAAVIDWELATLGDPLADFATFLVYSTIPPGGHVAVMPDNVRAEGFAGRDELVARYADRTGFAICELGFYLALGYWKLAIIYDGVLWRTRAGAYGESSGESEALLADAVARLAEAARTALAER